MNCLQHAVYLRTHIIDIDIDCLVSLQVVQATLVASLSCRHRRGKLTEACPVLLYFRSAFLRCSSCPLVKKSGHVLIGYLRLVYTFIAGYEMSWEICGNALPYEFMKPLCGRGRVRVARSITQFLGLRERNLQVGTVDTADSPDLHVRNGLGGRFSDAK